MYTWPRLALAADGSPTTVVFTASSTNSKLCSLLSDDFNFEVCLRKLPLDQQVRVRGAKHGRIKALALGLFSRVVLNYALYGAGISSTFEPFNEVPVNYNKYGKPSVCVENGPRIEYNSSSSNDLMAVVVQFNGANPVGIDLSHETQTAISATDFVEQFAGIFAPLELSQLACVDDISERYVFFNQFWTLKEAFTKFVGCGLNVDLSSFFFKVGPKRPALQNPEVVQGEYYNKLRVEWQHDIHVDYGALEPKFRTRISTSPIYCQSGVLKTGSALPVIISVVGQTPMEGLEVISVDMIEVVQSILDE